MKRHLGITIAALATLAFQAAQAQQTYSADVEVTAMAKDETQALQDWGHCVTITATAPGSVRITRPGTDDNGDAIAVEIGNWTLVKDTLGYPARRFTDFNGNPTNVFRGVTVEDGEDHLGNEYYRSSTGPGSLKAMLPTFYRPNELWIEIDSPKFSVPQYRTLKVGGIGHCK